MIMITLSEVLDKRKNFKKEEFLKRDKDSSC